MVGRRWKGKEKELEAVFPSWEIFILGGFIRKFQSSIKVNIDSFKIDLNDSSSDYQMKSTKSRDMPARPYDRRWMHYSFGECSNIEDNFKLSFYLTSRFPFKIRENWNRKLEPDYSIIDWFPKRALEQIWSSRIILLSILLTGFRPMSTMPMVYAMKVKPTSSSIGSSYWPLSSLHLLALLTSSTKLLSHFR